MQITTYLTDQPNKYITAGSRVLLEKLTVPRPVKKFPTFYGTRKSVTMFRAACHFLPPWARSIQSTPSRQIYLTLNSLTWKIWWPPNNVRKWQMGYNSAFRGLRSTLIWYSNVPPLFPRGDFLSGFHTRTYSLLYSCYIRVKRKAVPLQVWSGPEGSRNLRFPDFMTTAKDGGKVVSLTHRPLLPTGNSPGTHLC
jgi:hypothetical protein